MQPLSNSPTHPPAAGTWRLAPAAVALFIGTLLVLSPALRNSWTGWDDTAYVLNNPLMHAPDALARIWTTRDTEQFYPLTFTSYYVQHAIFGAAPAGYHAVNLVLHALNAVLCLALARALGLGRWAALFAAALFAIHPTQVMSVAWIAEHKNTLCGTFAFASALAWVRSARSTRVALWYAVSLLAFVLAMLAKTAVIGLPFALVLLDTFVLRTTWGGRIARIVPMLIAAVALGVITYLFEQKFVDRQSPDWIPSLAQRLQIAGAAPWAYLWHLAWPWRLSPAYGPWGVDAARLLWWLPLGVSALAGVALLVGHGRGRVSGWWVWGAGHFLLLLGPTLGIIAFGNLAVTPVSDHFLYLASFGLFLPAARAGEHLAARLNPTPIAAGAALALVACGLLSFRDTRVYRDAVSMWTRGVEVAPNNYTAHLALAEGLSKSGRVREALPHYQRAVELRPNWPDAWLFLGATSRDAGDIETAARAFGRAFELSPANVEAAVGLASVLELQGEIERALALFEGAVAREPRHLEARLGLAKMYLGYARYSDALSQFEAARALRPDLSWTHLGVATSLRGLRRHADAIASLREGLRRVPDDVAVLNMLARLLSTAPDDSARNGPEGVELASRAVEIGGGHPHLLDTLAAALAESGRAADASRVSSEAAALHARYNTPEAAAQSRELAARYAQGERLRE
ncbi:MAG: tetratricopeptide repeat protein [Planctomycetota bacterium]|nr:tetratricopeptide repeat protein [Planctomycetota bacterium]